MRKKVSEMRPGEAGKVERLDPELAALISGRGIRTGSRLEVETVQPMNGPLVLKVNGSTTSLGRKACQGIIVEVDG